MEWQLNCGCRVKMHPESDSRSMMESVKSHYQTVHRLPLDVSDNTFADMMEEVNRGER